MAISGVKHVVCALSGGVDSAVAALLLKWKGYQVSGLFMRNWDQLDETGVCTADKDCEDARFVCDTLHIPFHEVNFVKDYWHDVFSNFLKQYERGLTPNPDVMCNKYIKFDRLMEHAFNKLGADAVATGHYARTSQGDSFLQTTDKDVKKENSSMELKEAVRLLRAVDSWKDQTFFLSQVSQKALQRTIFPLGDLTKDVVKKIAVQAGMERIAKKKESMGICFIGDRHFQKFIKEYIETKPGNFVGIEDYKVKGQHEGHFLYTIGQRAGIQGYNPRKMFVTDKNPDTNEVFVAPGTNHPALFHQTCMTDSVHWIHQPPLQLIEKEMLDCFFRFQHADPLVKCTLTLAGEGSVIVSLQKPLRALTPGQYAVFYLGEECLGSAQIQQTGPSLYSLNWKQYHSGDWTWNPEDDTAVDENINLEVKGTKLDSWDSWRNFLQGGFKWKGPFNGG
ncbi:Mitochondrial tRNA-specific 2-thiouridylase 1 [Holothuria leucospilota]|uniref:tRNA-5-taurinomethyluridine 2-sulfurtransferase n=1 Tax=Holothuria leucospilota TaxID=206669 RepID=A0A9Q1HJ51_HOLLE|nr:Mitochondrial tRNA-specific 2-thiouridylase 1 [Holothuria leucospilota]